ncbi:MAG: hypothetical protein IH629_03475 [Thermoleophilia bacterium]|nr:hypothetical protein [Thermoleophilia bacterium]
MTALARIIAAAVGIVCLLLAGAVLVRQAALAVDSGVRWPAPTLWGKLTGEPTWTTTGVAAGVMVGITVILIVLAFLQVSGGGGPEIIEYAVEDGTARLSVPALGKALRRRFHAMLPASQVNDIAVRKDASGWSVRVEASVPVCDLGDVHAAMLDAFRDDMRRVAGIELVRLDLVVTSMRAPAKRS